MTISKLTRIAAVVAFTVAPAAAQESPAPAERKAHVFLSALFNTHTFTFSHSRSFSLYHEDATFRGTWSSDTGPSFGVGASYAVSRKFCLGVAFEVFRATSRESFESRLPHPFFFNKDRRIEGESSGLSYDETALHMLLGHTRTFGRFVVAVSAGPSIFWTSTEIVDDITFTESYPFEEAILSSVQRVTHDATKAGFNLGGYVGFRPVDVLAVGLDLKYSRGTPRFTTSGGTEVEVNAGGFRAGLGVRFLF